MSLNVTELRDGTWNAIEHALHRGQAHLAPRPPATSLPPALVRLTASALTPNDACASQSIFAGVFGPMQIGVILAVSGNLVIACSLALQAPAATHAPPTRTWQASTRSTPHAPQKWVHNSIASKPEEARGPASHQPLFWVALIGLMLGEVGNFAAFGLASPTVVSPLGAVAVIANALIAALILREPFFLRNLLGLFLTVAGAQAQSQRAAAPPLSHPAVPCLGRAKPRRRIGRRRSPVLPLGPAVPLLR